MRRRAILSLALALFASVASLTPAARPATADAAGCVRFINSQFDAPGNDHYNLNEEWVRIKNVCATKKSLAGWRIHDYNRIHTYTFASGVRIGPGKTITLYTGSGSDSGGKRYWRQSQAVWNNDPPEWAFLRKADGTLVSKWAE